MKTEKLIKLQIKSSLFAIGFNEKYVAFDYLTELLLLSFNQNLSTELFKNCVEKITNKYNISTRTLTQGINKLMRSSIDPIITSKALFHVNFNSTLNKLIVIKNYVESVVNEVNPLAI